MSEQTLTKKELKHVEIIEVIKHHASSSQDIEGEWNSRFKIDFVFNRPFSFIVLGSEYTIDRIRLKDDEYGWFGNTPDVEMAVLYANEMRIFQDFKVSKLFLHKLYYKLREVQKKGEILDGWAFDDDIWYLLTEESESSE